MTGRWKKIRSVLTITLSTIIVFSAVPEVSFASNAAEAYEVTAGDESSLVEVSVVSDGDAPIVEEPTVSDGDASVTDEPTVSDGDSTLDPELYQSKKLKIKSLQNTIYTG